MGFLSQYDLDPAVASRLASVAGVDDSGDVDTRPLPPEDGDWNPTNPASPQAAAQRGGSWKPDAEQAAAAAADGGTAGTTAGASAGQAVTTEAAADADREAVSNGMAPPPPAAVVPAHWQPGTNEVHAQYGYAPEETAEARGVAGERIGAHAESEQAAYEAGQLKATRDVGYEREYADKAREYSIDQKALAQERERYVNNQTALLNDLAEKAQKEVDPEDYWKSHGGTAGKVFAAIGVGLGAFGAAISGGQNTAYQILQNSIDANIRAQEHNIAGKGKALDLKKNLYALNLDAFGDREQALKATRINYLDELGSMLDANMADASLPLKQRQSAAEMKQRVLADRENELKFFMERAHTQISQAQNEKFIPRQVVGGGGGGAKPLDKLVPLSDGTTWQLPTQGTQEEAIKKIQAHGQVQALDKEALALREQLKKVAPGSTDYETAYAKLNKIAVDRINTESLAQGQGVVKEAEMQQQLKLSPYLKGYGQGFVGGYAARANPLNDRDRTVGDNEIRAYVRRSEDQQRALVRGAGGVEVKRGFTRDASGGLTPAGQYTGKEIAPQNNLAPKGFQPYDPRQQVPTSPAPLSRSAETGEVFGTTSQPAAASGGGKRGHKK